MEEAVRVGEAVRPPVTVDACMFSRDVRQHRRSRPSPVEEKTRCYRATWQDLPTFMTHQADQSIFSILFKSFSVFFLWRVSLATRGG